MKPDKYIVSIELLLSQIPSLEQDLERATGLDDKKRIERLLNQRLKRLERLIPYKFRRELENICTQAGVQSNFIE